MFYMMDDAKLQIHQLNITLGFVKVS